MREIKTRTLHRFVFYCFDNFVLASLLVGIAGRLWSGGAPAADASLPVALARSVVALAALLVAVKAIADYARAKACAEYEFISDLRLVGDGRRLGSWTRCRHARSVTERLLDRADRVWRSSRGRCRF